MSIGGFVRAAVKKAYALSMLGMGKGPHVTRYFMYEKLKKLAPAWQAAGRLLSVSHSVRFCRHVGLGDCQITEANYPEYNILELPFAEGSFDIVVSDQVLEHVQGDPQQAIDESLRVVRPGGLIIHTTCLIHPIHGAPQDFWRFTPYGLSFLCRGASEVLEVGGWGNPAVWLLEWLDLRYEPVPESRWHPAHWIATWNKELWPVVTWVVARK
jgi:SAM-dependent methyltransferase